MKPMPILSFLLVCFLAAPAQAAQVTFGRTSCPLDGAETRVFEEVSQDTSGGWDSDGCRYSSASQWRTFALATCPKDLFTLEGGDFQAEFDAETLALLKAESARVLAEYPDLDAIQIWDRYAIAVRFYRILGKDDYDHANLYLAASWTARDEAVGVYNGLAGPDAAALLLDQGAQELKKSLTQAQRKTVLYNLARVAERAGENALRDRYLDAFEAAGSLDAMEVAALDRFRRMTREVEPKYQDLALESLARYLRGSGLPADRAAQARYVQADLLRRRGRVSEALPLYRKVAQDGNAPADVRQLADGFAKRLSRP